MSICEEYRAFKVICCLIALYMRSYSTAPDKGIFFQLKTTDFFFYFCMKTYAVGTHSWVSNHMFL